MGAGSLGGRVCEKWAATKLWYRMSLELRDVKLDLRDAAAKSQDSMQCTMVHSGVVCWGVSRAFGTVWAVNGGFEGVSWKIAVLHMDEISKKNHT